MDKQCVTVTTHIDRQVFTDFASFNAFYLQNRRLTLAVFPVLMIGLGVVNYRTGSPLFFWLFSAVGVLAPLMYMLFYHVSLKRQIAANALSVARVAYTVRVNHAGVTVSNDKENAVYQWKQVYRAYVLRDYVYVYITKARAFILPYADLQDNAAPRDLLAEITQNLEPIRLFDRRPRAMRR